MRRMERGFTLIELLTVIVLIGILSALSLKAFEIYRSNAAYASVETTLHNAVIAAEASQTNPDQLPPMLGWYMQKGPGAITNASAAEYLPGLRLPMKTTIWAMYNPGCSSAFCLSDFIQVTHCLSKQFAFWIRWGDGFAMTFRNIPGGAGGC